MLICKTSAVHNLGLSMSKPSVVNGFAGSNDYQLRGWNGWGWWTNVHSPSWSAASSSRALTSHTMTIHNSATLASKWRRAGGQSVVIRDTMNTELGVQVLEPQKQNSAPHLVNTCSAAL